MSKFLLLLLLSSSKFEFGKFQQIPKAEPVLELIRRSSSVDYSTDFSEIQNIFDAINGSANYAGTLKLQYYLNELEDTWNIVNLILRESIDVNNEVNSSLPDADTNQMIPLVLSSHGIVVKSAVKDIREGKYQPHSSLSLTAKDLVERHYETVLRSFTEIWTHPASFEHESKTDGKRGKSLSELYQVLTTKNILHRCGTGTSPQQVLMRLYGEIMKTDIIITEALIFLTLLKNVEERRYSANDEIWTTLRTQFVLRYNAYAKSFSTAFDEASREHRSCDPDKQIGWKRGTSFFELERYQQFTAFHRSVSESRRAQYQDCDAWANVVMNKRDNSTCEGPHSDACWMDPVERCYGFLSWCSPTAVARCINDAGNSRRYSWTRTTSSPEYKKIHTDCSGEGRHLHEGFGDTCMCRCYQNDNTISLDLSLSDIEEDRVITAMRLVQKDKTIFIQIKQGTLQPDGRIADESTLWKPSSPVSDNLLRFYPPGQIIYLDDLQGADDEVLTGIGFASISKYDHRGIKLQIRVTKFDYAEGHLANESRVISASSKNRMEEMLETNNPLDSQLENFPTTSMKGSFKRFIMFKPSNFTSDAGQTTLPLFDAVPVEGRPPSPLGGAGFFQKKIPDYGGFVSLRAIGINLAKYFKEMVRPYNGTYNDNGRNQ